MPLQQTEDLSTWLPLQCPVVVPAWDCTAGSAQGSDGCLPCTVNLTFQKGGKGTLTFWLCILELSILVASSAVYFFAFHY